jgi:hypothetical protein
VRFLTCVYILSQQTVLSILLPRLFDNEFAALLTLFTLITAGQELLMDLAAVFSCGAFLDICDLLAHRVGRGKRGAKFL